MVSNDLKIKLQNLLETQKLAVIATQYQNKPYTNLIAFTPINDYKEILFSTLKNTAKYQNIYVNNNVSILFDNRKNTKSDFTDAITVTALGTAKEVDKTKYQKNILNKHPNLKDFIERPDCVLIKIIVQKYIIVQNFQNVSTLKP